MEGFFDGADAVAKAMASDFAATAQGAPIEAPNPPFEPVSTEERTQVERVATEESAPIPTNISTPQKGVSLVGESWIESTSLATPHVISASDPFITLSQAVKDGFSLVVTASSIPNSAT